MLPRIVLLDIVSTSRKSHLRTVHGFRCGRRHHVPRYLNLSVIVSSVTVSEMHRIASKLVVRDGPLSDLCGRHRLVVLSDDS